MRRAFVAIRAVGLRGLARADAHADDLPPASSARTGATTDRDRRVGPHHRHGQDGLVAEEEDRLELGALLGGEIAAVDRHPFLERRDGSLEGGHLVGGGLVARFRDAPALVELPLGAFEVSHRELDLEHAEGLERIDGARHVGVRERPQHVDDGVDLADAGEEPVAEPFALVRTFDETADVGELHGGVDHVLALGHHGEAIEPLVEHLRDPTFGSTVAKAYGARRRLRQGVVQGRLAGVGQPTNPNLSRGGGYRQCFPPFLEDFRPIVERSLQRTGIP
jgi:hypothetical protein